MKISMWHLFGGGSDDDRPLSTTYDKPIAKPAIAWHELISFWIFGLCTEFGYVVMICAAYDILSRFDNVRSTTDEFYFTECFCYDHRIVFDRNIIKMCAFYPQSRLSLGSDGYAKDEKICTEQSPGVLLLADIVPSLMMSLVCPFLPLFKQ